MEEESKAVESFFYINTESLSKATQYVNTHNTTIDDALTQEEVLQYITDSWHVTTGNIETLLYKGVIITPYLLSIEDKICLTAVISVIPHFYSDTEQDDFEAYSLSNIQEDE